jgi:hypothetical protein
VTRTPAAITDAQALALKHRSDAVLEERRKEVARSKRSSAIASWLTRSTTLSSTTPSTLSGQGSLWAVQDTEVTDEHGKEKTLTADKVRGEVVDNFLRLRLLLSATRRRPSRSTVRWTGSATTAKRTPSGPRCSSAATCRATPRTCRAPSCRRVSKQASDLYSSSTRRTLSCSRSTSMTPSMNFYEAVRFGTQVAGFDKRTAAINALEVNKDPTKYESPYWKQKFDDISPP